MPPRLFLIIIFMAFAFVKCDYFPSQSANRSSQFENQIFISSNHETKIQDSTNIRQNLIPVALISSLATSVVYPPLKISVRRNAWLLSKNNGNMVTSIPNERGVATLTGGPANDRVLDFVILIQINDAYPNKTRVGGTEDGVGFPIQLPMLFYDKSYGSFEKALNHKNAVIQIIFHVVVGGRTPNPLFEPYGLLLRQIRKPNSTAMISAYNAFEWLLSTLQTGYYVYPGSYIDPSTGKQIPSVTNISPNFDRHPWLSYSQWEVFENLLNQNYQPQANPSPVYSLAGRSLTQADSSVCHSYH